MAPDAAAWCSELVGQEYWLRTDVIRIQGNYKATDATNVYPDGRIYHQGTVQKGVQITAQHAAEFTAEARRKLGFDKAQNAATVRTMEAGARVLMHDVEVKDNEIKVKITLRGSWYAKVKTTVRLKMAEGYTLEDVQMQFNVAFAEHEYQVKHAYHTDVVRQGMTTDEVTKVLGLSDTRIELGPKTVLVYDDLRLVFDAGTLTDAE
tara:strand:+ start:157 stop:774 length:618 start_codon:yes stop_codon:yes gene_type:complete